MFGTRPFFLIETQKSFDDLIPSLKSYSIIGVDLEANSLHAFRERISLIQVSTYDADYIIDPIKINDLAGFLDILGDSNVLKVMHGSDFDIVSFKRDYDQKIENLFDTLIAARFLRYENLGLASLINLHFGILIDKKYQKHNWGARPLYQEHLDYARGDTHWLLALHELLARKLKKRNLYQATLEESQLLTYKEWVSGPAYARSKGFSRLEPMQQRWYRALWELRDEMAEARDVPCFKVLPNQYILGVVSQSTTGDALASRLNRGPFSVRNLDFVELVEKAEKDPRPIEIPKSKKKSKPVHIEAVLTTLKNWRNSKVEQEGMDPMVVLSNEQLKNLSRYVPVTMDELIEVPSIRQWQCHLYGEKLISLVWESLPKKHKKRTVT